MAVGTVIPYAANIDDMSLRDLLGATLVLTLHTSSYTPNAGADGHSVSADLSNELPTGGGYTQGGIELEGLDLEAITGGWKLVSDPVEWTASSGGIPAWRYGVLRVQGSLWGKTNPLIGYFLGNNAPADVPATTEGNPLKINCPTGGWIYKARP